MAETPFLTLSSKDFLSGISPGGAHSEGALFYKADGVTPLYEAGVAQSTRNGLLMAGASGTAISGTQHGNFISSTVSPIGSSQYALFAGTSTGHIFQLTLDATLSQSFTDIHTVTDLMGGLEPLTSSSGGLYLFYFQKTQIGKYAIGGAFNDSWATSGVSTDYIRATHRYFDKILYSNDDAVGSIISDGAGDFTNDGLALQCPLGSIVTDISDDGRYAVIATTDNIALDTSIQGDTRILFWNGNSPSWDFECKIPDPFIFAVEKTPTGVYAFGVTGVWAVAFGAEPKKIFPHTPGIYSVSGITALKYGRAAVSHYGDALAWGGSTGSNYAIKTLGKLDQSAPSAYLHPFLTNANQNITLVNGTAVKGYIIVGDTSPGLTAYPFSSVNVPQTGVTAQTRYIPLPSRVSLERVDLIFGEPLASGDSVSLAAYSDESTATTMGTASYTSNGGVKRVSLYNTAQLEGQLSAAITFTAGAAKLRSIEFYGNPMTP